MPKCKCKIQDKEKPSKEESKDRQNFKPERFTLDLSIDNTIQC